MKSLNNYILEKLVINKKFKNVVEKPIHKSGKWYMSAQEVSDALVELPSKGQKPAQFIFYAYELYPDYDVHEWGVTDQFPYNEKNWYCTLSSKEKFPGMPALEVISYDFKSTEPNDIICVGDKWNAPNNNGVYVAKNKKYRIISIEEDNRYTIFRIDNKK